MRILYITNYHNPYRDEFFERLGKRCDLTVLFEQRVEPTRDSSWFKDVESRSYNGVYLPSSESGPVSLSMLRMIAKGWSLVVVGCYNSPMQLSAVLYMRRKRIPYVINSDGPLFTLKGVKGIVRRHALRGADAYLVAGELSASSFRHEVGSASPLGLYHFSSFNKKRIIEIASIREDRDEKTVLLVGQFQSYKGIDVALMALKFFPDLRIRLIGTGENTCKAEDLVKKEEIKNIEIVPFLKPDELIKEYLRAGLFILPSRQECWGLVINEAAACGCPIISTSGSGAAIDFLSQDYPFFLAAPGNTSSLVQAIKLFYSMSKSEKKDYSTYLQNKAKCYSIERMVDEHLDLFEVACAKKQ